MNDNKDINILVIMCDQLRYDALSCNGNKFCKTPNIDRLAEKSICFERGYTQSPVCGPARHTLATGKYPYQHGVINNDLLPFDGMFTIAHALAQKGYRRYCFGHMHWQSPDIDTGYEAYLGIERDVPKLLSDKDIKQFEWEKHSITKKFTAGATTRTKEQFWGQLIADESIKKLEECVKNGEKFLSWISFHEPHPPFYPPKEFYDRFDQASLPLPDEVPDDAPSPHISIVKKQKWDRLTDADKRQMKAGYYGMAELVDTYVGEVLDTLDRLNLWEKTMIFFTVDHGEQMGDHDLFMKFVMREPSVHLPFMVYHPKYKPGVRIQLVEHTDVFPTVCDYTGIDIPEDVEGRSLRPLLENEKTPEDWRDFVISQIDTTFMILTDEWKLNIYNGEPGELYNMKDDPKEFNNLIERKEYAEIVKVLFNLFKERHPEAIEKSAKLMKSERVRAPKPAFGYDFN